MKDENLDLITEMKGILTNLNKFKLDFKLNFFTVVKYLKTPTHLDRLVMRLGQSVLVLEAFSVKRYLLVTIAT